MPRISCAEQAQIAKIPGILIRLTEAETRLSALRTTVDVNKEACDAAHGEMRDGISANQEAILGEKHDRETADTSLQSSIASKAEKTALEEVESALDAEKVTRENKDTALGGRIDDVEAALSAEIQNRKNADSSIRTDVDATVRVLDSTLRSEITSTKGSLETKILDAKADLLSEINEEKSVRQTEDGEIRQSVIDEKTRAETKESALSTLIATKETSIRHDFGAADDELSGRISANAQEIAANKVLFDAAVNDFERSVVQLGKAISDETDERERVDAENLQAAKDFATGLLSSALRYQGQVANLTELNEKTATAIKGDMWNVLNDGEGLAANYAFNGVGWDRLTESIDLSAYAKKTDVATEKTRAEAKEAELDGKIAANTQKINTDVGAETQRAKGAEAELLQKISTETAERKAKDTEIETSISGLAGELEKTEHDLNSLIVSTTNAKELAAIGRENAIKTALQNKDLQLEAAIGAVDAKVDTNKTNIENAFAQEVADREEAVKEVRDQLKVTDITGEERLVGMGEVLMKIAQKQDLLQSGINIKTINGKSILGSGNLVFSEPEDELARLMAVPYTRMSKIADYLYALDYHMTFPKEAKEFFDTEFTPPNAGACSSFRNGNWYCRNYDWLYEDAAEMVIRMSAADGRHGSIGVAAMPLSKFNEEMAKTGVWTELYKVFPHMLLDGINDEGVFANLNVVHRNGRETSEWSGRDVCALGAIREILDRFDNAEDAAHWVETSVYVPKNFIDITKCSFHFMIGDKNETWIVEDGRAHKLLVGQAPAMTNFRLFNGNTYTDGLRATIANYDLYGAGIERYNIIKGGLSSVTDKESASALAKDIWYTRAYPSHPNPPTPFWYSEFVSEDDGYTLHTGDEELRAYADRFDPFYRAGARDGKIWKTLHSCVYDIENRTLRLRVQEIDSEFAFGIVEHADHNKDVFGGAEFSRPTSAYEWYQLVERIVNSLGGRLAPEE